MAKFHAMKLVNPLAISEYDVVGFTIWINLDYLESIQESEAQTYEITMTSGEQYSVSSLEALSLINELKDK